MSNFDSRLDRLESKEPPGDVIAWAELLEGGQAVLRYQDGRRVEVLRAEIPHGVKCYQGPSPDDWNEVTA